MLRFLWFILCYSFLRVLLAQSVEESQQYMYQPSVVYARLPYLLKDYNLDQYFSITENGISIYASEADRQIGRVECHLYPNEIPSFLGMLDNLPHDRVLRLYQEKGTTHWEDHMLDPYKPIEDWIASDDADKPLMGLRVALDPGHVAGSLEEAELEGKYIKVRKGAQQLDINFWEADLTLATALMIQRELANKGAEVMLTRQLPGYSSMGIPYSEWKRRQMKKDLEAELRAGRITLEEKIYFQRRATDRDLFRRFFNQLDLRNRAKLVNAFKPHIVLIIHYNVDKDNWEKRDAEGYFQPGNANYCMAFVPGGIMSKELSTPEDRMYLLYALLTQNIQKSRTLASDFIEASVKHTQVEIVSPISGPDYLQAACRATPEAGVYARNLALTRMITRPLCYGESLCQDHWKEIQELSKAEIEIQGLTVSRRIQEVADAYVETVLNYTRGNK